MTGGAPATIGCVSPIRVKSRFWGNPMLKDLIEYLAKSLVDHPDQVSVNEVEGNTVTILELSVVPEDLGKVIGKQGRTAKAMRSLLLAAGVKARKKAILEIVEHRQAVE